MRRALFDAICAEVDAEMRRVHARPLASLHVDVEEWARAYLTRVFDRLEFAPDADPGDAAFLDGVADFYESHGRDEGGYSPETRAEFAADAARIRRIAEELR